MLRTILFALTTLLFSAVTAVASVPLPEYPRPTLVRSRWLNLNGVWELATEATPSERFQHRINVPFPLESQLSGVSAAAAHVDTARYRRTFTIPNDWSDAASVRLHFGAVDWESRVFVNGQHIGTHYGGYDPFSFDITTALNAAGKTNTLEVAIWDPTERGGQPRGRQSRSGGETFHTPTTGIWQTVWLEPLPAAVIERIETRADIISQQVTVNVAVAHYEPGFSVRVKIMDGATHLASCDGGSDGDILLSLAPHVPTPWSPESPKLYGLDISILDGLRVIDHVTSYFAFRDVALATDTAGRKRLTLNGAPVFWRGVVDQGMWRDGLYTPPTDEAIQRDIRTAKELGFNLIRKYDKLESERWYYWCDRLGVAIWQDVPSGRNSTAAEQKQFISELEAMVQARRNHPSIIFWSLFSEGHGQFPADDIVERVKALAPATLICTASGWNETGTGDITSSHSLSHPTVPQRHPQRASVIGFYTVPTAESFLQQYTAFQKSIRALRHQAGIDAAIFHQLTDVEADGSGLMTYDRQQLKIPAEVIKQINSEK